MASEETFTAACATRWTADKMNAAFGEKRLLLTPANGGWLLRQLNLLDDKANMPRDRVKKFLQVNHLLQALAPKLDKVASQNKTLRLLDACCGTSYLTLAVAWYMREVARHPAEIIGIDSNADVIETSRKRAAALGYDAFLKFRTGMVHDDAWDEAYATLFPENASGRHKLNVLVALHACDTATDHALSLAFRHKANLVAVAPCCQAELAALWQKNRQPAHPMAVVFTTPNLRREVGAQVTDAMRALLAQACGYETTVSEFIASEHTPKNRLILAERRQEYDLAAHDAYERFREHCAAPDLALARLLRPHATVFARASEASPAEDRP